MVRKRSRTARKYYDENDSDSDFTLEDPPSEPAPKKYSLRQRKRRLFTEFEFDDDGDEIEPTKVPSDDDDFQVEKELELDEAPGTEYIDKETYINHYEPENEDIPEDADGLIDFEDMIRADIVVNKNRIDYDNIIQKTEIKVQPIVETVQPVMKSKRGRKPKVRPEGEIDSSLLEPETEMQETEFYDKDDGDYNPADDLDNEELIDCAQLMHAELSECANETSASIPNEISNEANTEDSTTPAYVAPKEEDIKPDNVADNTDIAQDLLTKVNEDIASNINQDTVDIKGKVSMEECSNNIVTADETSSKVVNTGIVDVDDDDVVLVEDEKKCEVIVLDD
ncbi:uncharacterized protein LOC108917367 [Anoplophora glabripennis]|uniref:uncharacterized protein LOC108917367 n=1 Tax=Anoplophora glabripennis TaxID=217634 RepID=UPI00087543BB|nr:uncharacterized protein LOC108917367 [Anoplophora glabripennis]